MKVETVSLQTHFISILYKIIQVNLGYCSTYKIIQVSLGYCLMSEVIQVSIYVFTLCLVLELYYLCVKAWGKTCTY